MVIKFINVKELLESLVLVINLKRLLNVKKELDKKTWIECDSLHAWLLTLSRCKALVSS